MVTRTSTLPLRLLRRPGFALLLLLEASHGLLNCPDVISSLLGELQALNFVRGELRMEYFEFIGGWDGVWGVIEESRTDGRKVGV